MNISYQDEYVPSLRETVTELLVSFFAPFRVFRRLTALEESFAVNEAVLNATFAAAGKLQLHVALLEAAAAGRAEREKAAAIALGAVRIGKKKRAARK